MNNDVKEDFPFPTGEKHEASPSAGVPVEFEPSEDAIDQGVAESFPASDPLSVTTAKAKPEGRRKQR